MWLARKFESKKWERINHPTEGSVVGADAVTSIRSKNHELSFWEINDLNNTEEINEVFVAICASADRIQVAEIAIIKKESLSSGFDLVNDPMESPLIGVDGRHYDLKNMSGNDAAKLADIIMNESMSNCDSQVILRSEADIVDLITKYHQESRIRVDKLKKNVKSAAKII